MMPRLTGHEVAEVLSVFRPGLPVLAMSGAAIRLEPDRRLPVHLAGQVDLVALGHELRRATPR
jgi:hypothetical protein